MKYILCGSAPYIREYWSKIRDSYKGCGFLSVAVNNAWFILKETGDLDEWFIADDFLKKSPVTGIHAGSLIPDHKYQEQMPITRMPQGGIRGYLNFGGGCMTLNVLHILFNRAVESGNDLTVVVSGSDFVYEQGKDNFFYGKSDKLNPHVQGLLEQNNPNLKGINADPLRFGDQWLDTELLNVKNRYELMGFGLYVDTPLENTRLPFKKWGSE